MSNDRQLARVAGARLRICLGCGCTEAKACKYGCTWIATDVDVCSDCAFEATIAEGWTKTAALLRKAYNAGVEAAREPGQKLELSTVGVGELALELGRLQRRLEAVENGLAGENAARGLDKVDQTHGLENLKKRVDQLDRHWRHPDCDNCVFSPRSGCRLCPLPGSFRFDLRPKPPRRAAGAAAPGCRSSSSRGSRGRGSPAPSGGRRRARAPSSRKNGEDNAA